MDHTQPDRAANAPEGRRLTRRSLLIGAAAAGAAGAAAVGVPALLNHRAPAAAPPGAPNPLDAYHPGDAAFFARFRLPGADELEHYASVESMTRAASAVVVGRVIDVVPTRTIVGEAGDRVAMVGLIIQPRVLAGGVSSASRRRLVVEFVGGSAASAATAELRQNLPEGEAIWFLRAKAEEVAHYRSAMKRLRRAIPADAAKHLAEDARYYRLVSSQGFFIQGRDRVEDPMSDPEDQRIDPLHHRTAKIRRLSELSSTVQAAR